VKSGIFFAFSGVLLRPNRIRIAALGLCGALVEFKKKQLAKSSINARSLEVWQKGSRSPPPQRAAAYPLH
jgi:hypothetical protein